MPLKYNTKHKLKYNWAVLVDDDYASVLESDDNSRSFRLLVPFCNKNRHKMETKNASLYLEDAFVKGKFGTLMIVGEAESITRFRRLLKDSLKQRIAAEIIRPKSSIASLDSGIDRVYA